MININVFSEEKAWSKRLRNKNLFFQKICNAFPGAGPDTCDTIGWFMIGGTISVILGLLCLIGFIVNPQTR